MTPRFPFSPYPNGWFLIAYSDELGRGAVLPLSYFGSELVLFRGEDGSPHLVDAYCPHLGAHLGHGGTVCGTTIRCPFHGWRFDGSGACVEIPGVKKIPAKAILHSWPLREHDGMIFVYHHAEGKVPDHEPLRIGHDGDQVWSQAYRFRSKLRTHPQEMMENIVDKAHFKWVHVWSENPESEIVDATGPSLRVRTQGTTSVDGGTTTMPVSLRSCMMGLGVVETYSEVDLSWHFVDTFTPIDGEYIDVRISVRIGNDGAEMTPADRDMLFQEIERQHQQDVNIVEHKRYRATPMLCETDGPILAFRRWASQFYTSAAT